MRAVIRMATLWAQGRLLNAILLKLRLAVYRDKLQRLSFRFFDANETGSLINRATSDAVGVSTFAQFAIIDTFMLVVTMLVYFIYMMQLNTLLALLALGDDAAAG